MKVQIECDSGAEELQVLIRCRELDDQVKRNTAGTFHHREMQAAVRFLQGRYGILYAIK